MSDRKEKLFEPEGMLEALESFDSVSTENSEEDGGTQNRAYVPCGVGATVQTMEDGHFIVLGVVTGSQLQVGDILLRVNDQSVQGQSKEVVAGWLQGRAGSHVNVMVIREGTSEAMMIRLTRHYKARRGATRQHRSGRAGTKSPVSPKSPGSDGKSPAVLWPAPNPATGSRSGSLRGSEKSFDPESSEKSFDPERSQSMDPEKPVSEASFDPELSQHSIDPERSHHSGYKESPAGAYAQAIAQADATLNAASRSSGRFVSPKHSQVYASEKSFDPERSFQSEKSFDPEKNLNEVSYASGRSYDPEASFVNSDMSFDPERISFNQSRSTDFRASPPSKFSPPQGRSSLFAQSEASIDPERYSFASEASFDPEASSYGLGGNRNSNEYSVTKSGSFDPENSPPSPAMQGREAQNLDHIAAMLRQAIKGDPQVSMTNKSFDPEQEQDDSSRVCSTVMSFDPERSFAAEQKRTSVEPSFDPSEATGIMSGPEYDPSVEFGNKSQLSGELDPETMSQGMSEASFDPDNLNPDEPDTGFRPRNSISAKGANFSPQEGRPRSRWGGSVTISITLQNGKFLLASIWGEATRTLASVGDEVMKVDGLALHGMQLEETMEVLEGPVGTLVELELRDSRGALKFVTLSRCPIVVNVGSDPNSPPPTELSPPMPAAPNSYATKASEYPDASMDQTELAAKYYELETKLVSAIRSTNEEKERYEVEIAQLRNRLQEKENESRQGKGLSADMQEILKDLQDEKDRSAEKDRLIDRLRHQVEVAADFNEKAAREDAEKDQELASVRAMLKQVQDDKGVNSLRKLLEERDKQIEAFKHREKNLQDSQADDQAHVSKNMAHLTQQLAAREDRLQILEQRLQASEEAKMSIELESQQKIKALESHVSQGPDQKRLLKELQDLAFRFGGESKASQSLEGVIEVLHTQAELVNGWMRDSKDLSQFSRLCMDLLNNDSNFDETFNYYDLLSPEGNEAKFFLQKMIKKHSDQISEANRQSAPRQRSYRGRKRSSRAVSEASFDPSEMGVDLDSDEDDRSIRNRSRVMGTKSEISFDPSVWADDDDDSEEYGEDECGIGASFRVQDAGEVEVIGVVNNGPAERSGVVQVGDTVLSIDGIDMHGKEQSEVLDLIMGPADTLVELQIRRENTILTVEVRREFTGRRQSTGPQKSGEFDPSEFAGSDSEGSDEECGIGLSVEKDDRGLFRVTEVVLGGGADSTGSVRVGDTLQEVDGTRLSRDMDAHEVTLLLRGPPRSLVDISLSRDGRPYSISVPRDPSDARVWAVLSEYSRMHPDEFEGSDDGGEEGPQTPKGKASNVVDGLKRKLLSQNEDIAVLNARMEEAERAKEGLLSRINQMLLKAQDEQLQNRSQAQNSATQSPEAAPDKPTEESPTKSSPEKVFASNSSPHAPLSPDPSQSPPDRSGVGIVFKVDRNGFFRVVDMAPGGPAAKAGKVHIGDILLMANGKSVRGLSQAELANLILGISGSWLELGLQRVDPHGLLVVTHVTVQRGTVWNKDSQLASAARSIADSEATDGQQAPSNSKTSPEKGEDTSNPCGVGITFGRNKAGFFVVKALAPGGPAALAEDIRVHDTLVSLGGKTIKGMRYDELTSLILGPQGSTVVLGFLRRDVNKIVNVELQRAQVGPVGRPADKKMGRAASTPRGRVVPSEPLPDVPEEPLSSKALKVQFLPSNVSVSHDTNSSNSDPPQQPSPPKSNDGTVKCGVGLTFKKNNEGYFGIVAVNSQAAADAGLVAGDVLIGVEGQSVKGLEHSGLSTLVLGPQGSLVRLELRRQDGSMFSALVVRHKPVGLPDSAGPGSGPLSGTVKKCGVGVIVSSRRQGYCYVESLVAGGAASRSRLVAVGDLLIAVNGKNSMEMTEKDTQDALDGPLGSVCLLVLGKADGGRMEVALQRAPISEIV